MLSLLIGCFCIRTLMYYFDATLNKLHTYTPLSYCGLLIIVLGTRACHIFSSQVLVQNVHIPEWDPRSICREASQLLFLFEAFLSESRARIMSEVKGSPVGMTDASKTAAH